MPRLKTQEVPFVRVRRLLLGYGFNGPKLARVLGCAPKTARARLERPETFSLAELSKVSTGGGIPIEEIRAAIMK